MELKDKIRNILLKNMDIDEDMEPSETVDRIVTEILVAVNDRA